MFHLQRGYYRSFLLVFLQVLRQTCMVSLTKEMSNRETEMMRQA